jgi:hypothetical protein
VRFVIYDNKNVDKFIDNFDLWKCLWHF